MTEAIHLQLLERAVSGGFAAIRAVTRLKPAGGSGDKIFPPTYAVGRGAQTRYAIEPRTVDGKVINTVLLDSVASQANRMEEALLEGYRLDELHFPLVEVDFTGSKSLEDLDRITSLQAPHRIADALLRDSMRGKELFRETTEGREFTDSRPNHATGMYKHCPTALIFGCWDSTGPKGGLGSKFARCLVAEIVGYGVELGVKTASRIDPAGILRNEGQVFTAKDNPQDWTMDPKEALIEKGKPQLFSRKSAEGKDKGTSAVINHGNIPPSIDQQAGGVTIEHAVQTVVLSLAGLRRLRFPVRSDGQRLQGKERLQAEVAARTALAALALAAVVYQRENDFDLRSRSLLIAENPLCFELLGRDGQEPQRFVLDRQGAAKLLADAVARAEKLGMGWNSQALVLTPAPKLVKLITVSRELAKAGLDEENAGSAGDGKGV